MNPSDAKLAALSLLEACWQKNDVNRRAIVNTSTDIEIVTGLIGIAAMSISQVAAQCGLTVEDVFQNYRAVLMAEQAGVI